MQAHVHGKRTTAGHGERSGQPPLIVRIRPEDVDLDATLKRAFRSERLTEHQREVLERRATSWAPQGARRKLAVLVTHGMGQQLPFETVATVAEGLIAQHPQFAGQVVPLTARNTSTSRGRRQHLEFQARDVNGERFEVHVHEAYWAPLTEGRVHLRDVLRFLYSGALNSLRTWRFTRYMFGRTVDCKMSPLSHLRLLLTTIILSFFVLLNAVVAGTLVGFVLREGFNAQAVTWPSAALVEIMSRIVAFFLCITALFGGLVWLAIEIKKRIRMAGRWQSHALRAVWRQTANAAQLAAWTWYLSTIVCFALMATAIALEQMDAIRFRALATSLENWPLRVGAPFWVLTFAAFGFMRTKLVQYMGDVAAYVSPHVLDRFMNIRQNIRKWVFEVAQDVYGRKGDDGRSLYDGVVLVGHSLGSVVIYDALNAVLGEDEANGRRSRVAERTRMLLTFGSPLDKTAFIFSQHRRPLAETRGLMAATVQPLICSYERFRHIRWVNVHSPRDPVSDALRLYDDPEARRFVGFRVHNAVDHDARVPLAAHVEYWDNANLYDQLWRGLATPAKKEASPIASEGTSPPPHANAQSTPSPAPAIPASAPATTPNGLTAPTTPPAPASAPTPESTPPPESEPTAESVSTPESAPKTPSRST